MKVVRMKKSGRIRTLTDHQWKKRFWKKVAREEPVVVKKPLPAASVFDQIVDAASQSGNLGVCVEDVLEPESKPKRRYKRRDMEAEDCSNSSESF